MTPLNANLFNFTWSKVARLAGKPANLATLPPKVNNALAQRARARTSKKPANGYVSFDSSQKCKQLKITHVVILAV